MLIASKSSMDTEIYALTFEVSGMLIHIKDIHNIIIIDIAGIIERKNVLVNKAQEKEDKKQVSGQLDLYNFKLAEIAHELDKVNVNELTPIEALNTLVRIKEEIKG